MMLATWGGAVCADPLSSDTCDGSGWPSGARGAEVAVVGKLDGADLGNVVSGEGAGSAADDEQQADGDGGGLEAGSVVAQALEDPLEPALGRDGVEGFFEAHAGARHEIGVGVADRVGLGQQLQREKLFLFLSAARASGQVPIEFVSGIVSKLAVGGHYDALMCQFAVHFNVLLASKKVVRCRDIATAGPPIAI